MLISHDHLDMSMNKQNRNPHIKMFLYCINRSRKLHREPVIVIIRPACLLSFDFIIKHIMDIKVNSIPRSFSKTFIN